MTRPLFYFASSAQRAVAFTKTITVSEKHNIEPFNDMYNDCNPLLRQHTAASHSTVRNGAAAAVRTRSYLPAHVRRFPLQHVLRERRGLQFVLVERQLVDHHGLTVHTGEAHHGVGRAGGLEGGAAQESIHVNGT